MDLAPLWIGGEAARFREVPVHAGHVGPGLLKA